MYRQIDRLQRSHHAAEVLFAIAGAPAGGGGRLELDVFANGKSCLARRWLDVAASASHHLRTLAVFNDDAANVIEFRIRAQGFATGALAFRGVSIRRSDPSRTWQAAVMRRLHDLRRRWRAWAAAAQPAVTSRRG